MFAWSNGSGYYNGIPISQFTSNTEESLPLIYKQKPKKIYIKDDCMIYLMPSGQVYKKGFMKFEQESQVEENKDALQEINFPQIDNIQKIKFGESHALFLGTRGDIYSWGNNYYGQLGINNMMIAVRNEPQHIKIGSTYLLCSRIHAYRNNSFAIDKQGTLYIWGRSDYLMGIYKSNLFRPNPFLSDFKVDTIKHSGGRMIIYAQKQDEIQQKVNDSSFEDGKGNGNENDMSVNLSPKQQFERTQTVVKSNKGDLNKNELDKNGQMTPLGISNIVAPEANKLDVNGINVSGIKSVNPIEKKKVLTNQNLNTIILNIFDYVTKINDNAQLLFRLRAFCLDTRQHYTKSNINQMWDKTTEIIKQAKQEKGDQFVKTFVKQVKIPNRSRIDSFCALFSVKLCFYYERLSYNQLNKTLHQLPSQLRNCESVLKTLLHSAECEIEKELLANMSNLLIYSTKYKTLENFIHQLALHQALLKQYDFSKFIKLFEDIISKQYEVDTKLYLVEKLYDNLLFLIAKYEITIQALEEHATTLDLPSEKFIYQMLIDTNIYIKNLWKNYIFHAKEDYLLQIKENQINFIYEIFLNLHKIQNKGVDFLNYEKNMTNTMTKLVENNSSLKESQALHKQLLKQCTQEEILNEMSKMDDLKTEIVNVMKYSVNKNYDMMTKELIVNYATSVYESLKLKQILLAMVCNVIKFGQEEIDPLDA